MHKIILPLISLFDTPQNYNFFLTQKYYDSNLTLLKDTAYFIVCYPQQNIKCIVAAVFDTIIKFNGYYF